MSTSRLISTYTARQLVDTDFPPGDELLGHDLLDRGGAMVIAGVQKVSKSFLAIQAAMCAMTNTPFLGIDPPEIDPNARHPLSVLMLQGEVGPRQMKKRIDKMLTYFAPAAERFTMAFTFHNVKIDNPADLARVVDEFFPAAVAGPDGQPVTGEDGEPRRTPDIVILDPFAWFHSKEENSTPDMTAVCACLDYLRHDHGCAVIVVHHQSKSGLVQNRGHRMRGSSVLAGWYETLISMDWVDPNAAKGPRWIEFELRNGEAPEKIKADFNPKYNVLEPGGDITQLEIEKHIIAVLLAEPDGYKGSDLAKQVYHATHHEYRGGARGLADALAKLQAAKVVKIDKGDSTGGRRSQRWVLTDTARTFLTSGRSLPDGVETFTDDPVETDE